jgi:methylated-DNA-[protein]-cysteine S-methyltransferase
MTRDARPCLAIEPDLIAAATGEATPGVAGRVDSHLAGCQPCRQAFESYRAVDEVVGTLSRAMPPAEQVARERLLARLSDLRGRIVRYRVFQSLLGPILLASTDQGIALVEYLGRHGVTRSRLFREGAFEPHEGGADLERFRVELMDYLAGRRIRLDWPLDLRLAHSDFHRAVLQATAAVPCGAVTSYAGIAHDIGKPSAVRAVAQALRNNPLAIVVPCHRIIGSGGALVGYAGSRIALKERLLAVEGVRTEHHQREARVARRAMYAWDHQCREYCLPSCGDISRRPIGSVTLFASDREARALGLGPCPDCRPDLHPLPS